MDVQSETENETIPWPRYLKEDYLESFSEAIADTGADGGAFRTPANTARHTHNRAASENLHIP